jgi:hypothetical protein
MDIHSEIHNPFVLTWLRCLIHQRYRMIQEYVHPVCHDVTPYEETSF